MNGCGRGACGARSTWSPGRPPWRTATSCRPYAGTGRAPDPASCRSTIRTQLHTANRANQTLLSVIFKHHLRARFLSASIYVCIWVPQYPNGLAFGTGQYRGSCKAKLPIIRNGQKWRTVEQLPLHSMDSLARDLTIIDHAEEQRNGKRRSWFLKHQYSSATMVAGDINLYFIHLQVQYPIK